MSTASPTHDIKVRSIPVGLWKAVHRAVIARGTTVRQFVIDALTATTFNGRPPHEA